MDYKKIFVKGSCPTKIGGQAVMEGIMMKGEKKRATVIRLPDKRLYMKTQRVSEKKSAINMPFIRGVVVFVDALVDGMKTLMYSADILEAYDDMENSPYKKSKFDLWLEKKLGKKQAYNLMITTSLIVAVIVTVAVFIIFPTWVLDLLALVTQNAVLLNVVEGLLRILLFVLYVVAISRMKEIHRVFQYHGAEHKTIHCFEQGLPLTPENCKNFYTLHPRCGTSFLVFVMVIALVLFSLLGWPNLFIRILSRLLLLPVIAGLSYELLKWTGRSDNFLVKILSMPGLYLQKLTTKEPDYDQLEVAIAAMNGVLDDESPLFEGVLESTGEVLS
ncbi:MAG: DUF1385 domain-containing protein [Anaerovoracaceae bacterium]